MRWNARYIAPLFKLITMILEMMCSNAKLFHLRFLMNRAESSRDMNRVAILKLSVTLPSPLNEDARKRKKSGTKK